MKIGLMGGTFDPVHISHINIAKATIKQFGLDEIWFLPDINPRRKQNVTEYRHRLAMLELACDSDPELITSKHHFQKSGTNYDWKILQAIFADNPDKKFFLICGQDVLEHINTWDNYQFFIDNIEFIVVHRYGTKIPDFHKKLPDIKYKILNIPLSDISASKVRSDTRKYKDHLDERVVKYIQDNRLYH